MPWFRDPDRSFDSAPFDVNDRIRLRALIAKIFAPGNFLVAPSLQLHWQQVDQGGICWEIYHGRLLDVKQTREMRRFESWGVFQEEDGLLAPEPVLSIKLDVAEPILHVVRGLLSYVWEGRDVGGNIIESHETTRWVRELVGSVRLTDFSSWSELADELICLLWQAVVGTSRLPLTSLETPLPAFALGQLAYVHGANSNEALVNQLGNPALSDRERAKILEWLLRQIPSEVTPSLASSIGESGLLPSRTLSLLRQVFNDVSLSPYTHFVDHTLDFVQALVDRGYVGRDHQVDFLTHLLRLQCKHLAAYDLFTFHQRGANYPDALLLDAVLGRVLRLVEQSPELWDGQDVVSGRRRSVLGQACLVRRVYEGHLVPDVPTSPGENQRVLPAPFQRVPEEQILKPARRQRKLFETKRLNLMLNSTTGRVLQQGLEDLIAGVRDRELGLAVFIDRPFGDGKHPLEPDQTPLLAHEVFSLSVAQRRRQDAINLARELDFSFPPCRAGEPCARIMPTGVPVALAAEQNRPVPSLADARRVAEDFRVLRTLPRGLTDFLELLRERAPSIHVKLGFLAEGGVLMRTHAGVVAAYDQHGGRRVELAIDGGHGFVRRAGTEFPRRLCVLNPNRARKVNGTR